MKTRRPAHRLALSLAAATAALAGCAANHAPATRPVPTGSRNVTLVGPIDTVGGTRVSSYAAPGGGDVYFVSPGRHTLTFAGGGYFQNSALHNGRSVMGLTLNLLPHHTYEFEVKGINWILRIHDATENRTIFFDPDTLVFFNEDRTPIDPDTIPLTRKAPAQ